MSTLLERMIQRTRGPLSSLEPVATPAFLASEHSQWAGQPWETIADEVAYSPRPDLGLPHDAPEAAPQPRDTTVRPGPIPVPAAQDRHPPHDDREPVLTPVTREPGEVRASEAEAEAAEAAGESREPAGREPADVSPAATGPHAAVTGSRPPVTGPRSPATSPRPPGGPRAKPVQAPVSARPLQSRRPAPAQAEPEITISIGHIEVRSEPVVVPQTPRPASQPKVGLADFLSRARQP